MGEIIFMIALTFVILAVSIIIALAIAVGASVRDLYKEIEVIKNPWERLD